MLAELHQSTRSDVSSVLPSPEFADKLLLSFSVISLAFPNNQALPSQFYKLGNVSGISSDIAFKFLGPEFCVALRHHCILASRMLVPEAAMHENNGVVFW